MGTWILILTIVGFTTQSGQSVMGVPGFTSEVSCMAAANAWIAQAAAAEGSGAKRALCVKA